MTELERATQAYCQEHNDDCADAIGDECPFIGKAFKAGAEWQYEQFEKERLKHCDELTAEQAQMESDFVVQHLKNFNRTPTFIDAIEYGSEAMKEKLTKLEELADKMYYAAQYLTTDASKLRKAMDDYWHYVVYELKEDKQ